MSEPPIIVTYHRVLLWPRWWRNPIRWWRWRRMLLEHNRRLRTDPLYRDIVEREERALLFGDLRRSVIR